MSDDRPNVFCRTCGQWVPVDLWAGPPGGRWEEHGRGDLPCPASGRVPQPDDWANYRGRQ